MNDLSSATPLGPRQLVRIYEVVDKLLDHQSAMPLPRIFPGTQVVRLLVLLIFNSKCCECPQLTIWRDSGAIGRRFPLVRRQKLGRVGQRLKRVRLLSCGSLLQTFPQHAPASTVGRKEKKQKRNIGR